MSSLSLRHTQGVADSTAGAPGRGSARDPGADLGRRPCGAGGVALLVLVEHMPRYAGVVAHMPHGPAAAVRGLWHTCPDRRNARNLRDVTARARVAWLPDMRRSSR